MDPILIGLRGDIDLAARDETVRLLDDGVARARSGETDLHVDLAEVTFLDSTGIGCLVRAATALSRDGQALRLCNPTAMTRRLLDLAGIDGLVADASPPVEG